MREAFEKKSDLRQVQGEIRPCVLRSRNFCTAEILWVLVGRIYELNLFSFFSTPVSVVSVYNIIKTLYIYETYSEDYRLKRDSQLKKIRSSDFNLNVCSESDT